MDIIHDIIS